MPQHSNVYELALLQRDFTVLFVSVVAGVFLFGITGADQLSPKVGTIARLISLGLFHLSLFALAIYLQVA